MYIYFHCSFYLNEYLLFISFYDINQQIYLIWLVSNEKRRCKLKISINRLCYNFSNKLYIYFHCSFSFNEYLLFIALHDIKQSNCFVLVSFQRKAIKLQISAQYMRRAEQAGIDVIPIDHKIFSSIMLQITDTNTSTNCSSLFMPLLYIPVAIVSIKGDLYRWRSTFESLKLMIDANIRKIYTLLSIIQF